MGKDKKTPIVLDGIKYNLEDMSPEQQAMVHHIRDLENKIGKARFNLDQLTVGHEAFLMRLRAVLPQIEPIPDVDGEKPAA